MNYESESLRGPRRRLTIERLKRCPLCGALNAGDNEECFVCTWQGAFDRDEESVEEALDFLLLRCPELAEEFVASVPKPGPFTRLKLWIVDFVARRLER